MIPYFQWYAIPIGPFHIYVWGLMVASGITAAIVWAYYSAKKRGLNYRVIPDLGFWVVLSALIGGRIFYILGEFEYYLANPKELFMVWEGGMSISGGFVFATIAGFIFFKKKKLDINKYLEVALFSLPLGLFIGRLGCFFIFDHPGTETNFLLGEKYADGLIRHNHGLYLSLEGLFIFSLFIFIKRFKFTSKPLFFTSLFLILDGVTRLILDFWRINDPVYFHLTIAQYLGIIMISLGVYLRIKYRQRPLA